MTTLDKVRKMLAEQLNKPIEKVQAESRFVEDLSVDSLDMIEMLMALEDEFAISVPNDQVDNMKTVGDIVAFIEKAVDKK